MPYSIACPKCRSKLVVKNDKLIGKSLPCPKCKFEFVVEAPQAVVTPAPAPAAAPAPDPLDLGLGNMDFSAGPNLDPLAISDDGSGAGADLLNVQFGSVETPSSVSPAFAAKPAVRSAAQPAPAPASTAAPPLTSAQSRKLLLIGAGAGFGAASVLFGCIWGIVAIFGSSDGSAGGSGGGGRVGSASATAKAGSSTAAIQGSPTLIARLKEHFAKQYRDDHPTATEDEAKNVAEVTAANEITKRRKFVEQFFHVAPEDEEKLKAGQLVKNSEQRTKLLLRGFKEARFDLPNPPGLDVTIPDTLQNPVDMEIVANYLEAELVQEIYRRAVGDPTAKGICAEMVRILREDDLHQFQSFGDLERVAREASKTKRIADLRKSAISDPNRDVRELSLNNLKQIGLALHNYHDTYKAFPAAVQIGPKNIPHSWRVTILPFVEGQKLYEKYRQDEPWDSPHNKSLLAEMPEVFRSPREPANSPNTAYFGFTLPPNPTGAPQELKYAPALAGNQALRISHITDGTSNTIFVVESKLDVPWTKPDDIPFDESQPLPSLGGIHQGGFCVVLCDGSTRFIADSLDRNILKILIGRRDGETVPDQ